MNKHMATKILVALLPAIILTVNWAWMSANTLNGIAFLLFWALLVYNAWYVEDKNKVLQSYFRVMEIAFFLLPISAIVLTFIVGSKAVTSSTSGAAQAGAAIGTAIGGTFIVGIGFVIGLFGGFIMHLIANKYAKKAKENPVTQPTETKTLNFMEKHKTGVTAITVAALIFIAIGVSGNQQKKPVDNKPTTSVTSDQNSTVQQASSNPATTTPAQNQEPSPLSVIKTSVTTDEIGTPVANVTVKNISAKTIDAFKVHITTFDKFGDPAKGFLKDNTYNGISQDGTIAPGGTYEASWTLYNYDTTAKVDAVAYQVHFTDDSSWESRQ